MANINKDHPALCSASIDLESLSEDNLSEIFEDLGSSTESRQKLKKLLECPICLELPLPPIFLCKRGHIVCNSCQDRTYYCPLCREEYTNTRSFVAEGLVENFVLKCRFREQGCPEVLKGSLLVNHLKTCDFRPVRCMYCQGVYIPFDEYFDHLKTKHNIDGVSKTEGTVKYTIPVAQIAQTASGIGKFCWAPSYFQCFEQTFMFQLHIAGPVCGWICLLGPESDCKKYETTIEFKAEKYKVCWTGQVNHFRADPITICRSGRGLVFPFDVIRSNANLNSSTKGIEWFYHVHVKEIPIEPQSQDTSSANTTDAKSEENLPDDGSGNGDENVENAPKEPQEVKSIQMVEITEPTELADEDEDEFEDDDDLNTANSLERLFGNRRGAAPSQVIYENFHYF